MISCTSSFRALSGSEVSALRDAISRCWNVGSLSTEALSTQILVYVEMERSGAPKMDSFQLLSFEGGTQSSADKVYRAARSALFRCGQRGLPLPPEKYDDWREIEIVFNPQGMQFR